ncbi:DUF4435 domain-containing protein [Novosphingobium sp. EMRT-2]|uniref:DUF4435 domain-containing protein n=1 Tax=Novosphingobium sp. EMRT-2 TaxID=2571749 RepID=UPI0010BD336E|nr:DUF4435 domain-containing protein [Novosphingobium sp. EMRT-2]QCI93896.1 DUF4435 domain-containing protein [Novosphingobium sp. EMRT-2]
MIEAFDRSASGRRNRALFYNVDRIVYVEGGRDDKGAMESFDGLFWRRVLGVVRPELRLRILPRGGKDQLIALAKGMDSSDEGKVIVAMDRDYDGIFRRTIDSKFVLYTYGYSFENDIFTPLALEDLFLNLCPVCDDTVDFSHLINELIDEFCKDAWWAQLADVCGGIVARKVIDRDHAPKYMMNNIYGCKPKLSKSALSIDVYKANSGSPRDRVRNIPYKKCHLPDFSVGHLYASFCYKIITYLHNIYSNTAKLTKDSVTSSAIANFAAHIAAAPQSKLGAYYQEALAGC